MRLGLSARRANDVQAKTMSACAEAVARQTEFMRAPQRRTERTDMAFFCFLFCRKIGGLTRWSVYRNKSRYLAVVGVLF